MNIQKKSRNENGGSMVEFVIIAPVLFIILFGCIEFGLLLYNQAVITNASREGARYGIVSRSPRYTNPEIKDEVRDYCDGWLVPRGNLDDLNIPDPIWDDTNGNGIKDFGDDLEVLVDFDHTFLVFSNLPLVGFGDTVNLSARAVMKYE